MKLFSAGGFIITCFGIFSCSILDPADSSDKSIQITSTFPGAVLSTGQSYSITWQSDNI